MRAIVVITLIAACFGPFAGVASAAPGDLLFTITPPDPQPGAGFGRVISVVDGDILVGEPSRQLGLGFNAQGRAYLFDGQTGALKLTFNNPMPTDLDRFAESVAGGDGRVFLATGGLDDRVYAYSTSDGRLLHTIPSPDGRSTNFASNVAYGAGSVLVSSPSFSGMPFVAQSIGQAYLFDGATGLMQRPLPNPEPKASDIFSHGESLAVFGNRAVVGAVLDDLPGDTRPDGDNPGRVWVFDRLTGDPVFTLENPNPESPFLSDSFGSSAAANDHAIVVGAMFDHTSGVQDSGTVYVFDSITGLLRHTLFSPQPERLGGFGESVAVTSDGNILTGAWVTDADGIARAGHTYLFDGETGEMLLDIAHPDPRPFAWSIAAEQNRIFVGAPATGTVYVLESIPEPSSLALAGVAFVMGWILHHASSATSS
jgi:outer membrane protein assembly factor BamB